MDPSRLVSPPVRRRPPAKFGVLGAALAAVAAGLLATRHAAADPPPPAASMEQALALLGEARRHFQGVKDYTCTLIKRERVQGRLLPENVMALAVRNRPFSVYLRWQAPRALEGQEVCYVAGRNDGLMRVHPVGLAGVVGFVSVAPLDPRALKDNRHPVTEAGLGNLLDGIARQWERERRLNRTVVRIADGEFNHRPCTWVETLHPDRSAGPFYAYRCVLGLDKATHLPVHTEAYDWPRPGGDPAGELLESYSFVNMRLNVGLGEETFKR
jgi:hypothetical protein